MHKRMKELFDLFEKKCFEKFNFLEKNFGCKIDKVKKESHGIYIVYKNKTTAVRISLEPREGGVFINLIRLIDGKLPTYPIFINENTELNWFDIDNIIALKAPEVKVEKGVEGYKEEEFEKVLGIYADALSQYASDILVGDFSIFPGLEKRVKERIKKMNFPVSKVMN